METSILNSQLSILNLLSIQAIISLFTFQFIKLILFVQAY